MTIEPLEPRTLLSGTLYTVTSLADTVASDGQLTLREAIQAANTNTALITGILYDDYWQQAYNNSVNIFDSIGPTGKIIITITSKAATKGAALQAACSHLDLKPEEVVAFGDAENDLAMFSVAGAGWARVCIS